MWNRSMMIWCRWVVIFLSIISIRTIVSISHKWWHWKRKWRIRPRTSGVRRHWWAKHWRKHERWHHRWEHWISGRVFGFLGFRFRCRSCRCGSGGGGFRTIITIRIIRFILIISGITITVIFRRLVLLFFTILLLTSIIVGRFFRACRGTMLGFAFPRHVLFRTIIRFLLLIIAGLLIFLSSIFFFNIVTSLRHFFLHTLLSFLFLNFFLVFLGKIVINHLLLLLLLCIHLLSIVAGFSRGGRVSHQIGHRSGDTHSFVRYLWIEIRILHIPYWHFLHFHNIISIVNNLWHIIFRQWW